jgi:hypothetical protein
MWKTHRGKSPPVAAGSLQRKTCLPQKVGHSNVAQQAGEKSACGRRFTAVKNLPVVGDSPQ